MEAFDELLTDDEISQWDEPGGESAAPTQEWVAITSVADLDIVDDKSVVEQQQPDGDEKYRTAIRKGDIVYTCNAGWIDKTHFEQRPNRDPRVGARSLWNQITSENGQVSNAPNQRGFQVAYRQDAYINSTLGRVGITRNYYVQYGLSLQKKEQVAMAIFQQVSVAFERFQFLGYLKGRGDSALEPADLISDLLGLYSVVRPALNANAIMQLSKPLTSEQSLEILKQYPGTFTKFEYKTTEFLLKDGDFKPRYFPNRFCSNPVFPVQFQSIQPAAFGSDFRPWNEVLDGGGPR